MAENFEAYLPETAEMIYAEIKSAADLLPNYEDAYRRLYRTLTKILEEQTRYCEARLAGNFAKLDYLLKERGASPRLRTIANDARIHLQKTMQGDATKGDLCQWWVADLEGVSRLAEWLYGTPLPVVLEHLLPQKSRARRRSRTTDLGEYVRMIVARWDKQFVYGRLEREGVTELKLDCSGDRAYLIGLLWEGAQLNLLRPSVEEGMLTAEIVVLEPDYLVDVSSVAKAFECYAESPLVSLVKRLEPSEETGAILMGQMAGQLLDEELRDEGKSYQESAKAFFQNNALGILTTELPTSFHEEANAQRKNIHNAIYSQLPQMSSKYNPREVVVEPSFVSEMLGLQGRMDFLQLDMRVLIEQKSGKADFVPRDPTPDVPRQREEHYVQMLLYMAILRYNYRQQYEANQRQLHAFLLYSKYPRPLVGLGFAPELLKRALVLRNRMVALDRSLARDGFGLLATLTPELLNEKGVKGRLWEQWVRPRLEQVLKPFRDASTLERDYVLRMLRFVAAEHELSKLGNQTKENSGFACLWHDSLEEKLSAGNIYDRMTLLSPLEGDGRVERVRLRFASEMECDMSNFRTGDIVLLYPYAKGTVPDARKTMVFRGTISEIAPQELEIGLRNMQTDAYVFARDKDKFWAVEHDFMESSYSSLYRGLHAFLSAPQTRRDLLMLRRTPRIDTTLKLKGDYAEFNTLSLRVKQARDLFLIIGPPGTGKTSFGMMNTLLEELAEEGTSVLVTAYTNRAVDEICSKLHGTIGFIRLGSKLSCLRDYQQHLFSEQAKECSNVNELRSLILRTRVFVGTTTALSASQALFGIKRFSLAIVDEASQILEPHLMALLSAVHHTESAIDKFVLIGDHKQLPAVVQQLPSESKVEEEDLHRIGLLDCRLSLFERLLRRYGDDPRFCYMLTRQGRMHPDIAAFPNEAFYGGRLDVVPLAHQTLPSHSCRLLFFDVPAPSASTSDKVNQAEADVIAQQVKKVCSDYSYSPSDVGIIVPYRNQISTVRSTLDKLGDASLRDIAIDTVERYQGSQRKVIIYGFTVQQYYQLRFLTDSTFLENGAVIDRKLNVAMTRAQERLILVGNASLLARNAVFSRLIDFVKQKGGYTRSE